MLQDGTANQHWVVRQQYVVFNAMATGSEQLADQPAALVGFGAARIARGQHARAQAFVAMPMMLFDRHAISLYHRAAPSRVPSDDPQRRRRLNACGPFSPGRTSNCTSSPSRRSSK